MPELFSRYGRIIIFLVIASSLIFLFKHPLFSDETITRYPHQQTYWKYNKSKFDSYHIVVVADMDKASKVPNEDSWMSQFLSGTLEIDHQAGSYTIKWGEEANLFSKFNEAGRGLELSELTYFNNHLYSGDDRTGIIYDITKGFAVPSYILMDGDGSRTKGFKIEWSTVKDGKLYIGSMGKEWVQEGVVKSIDPMWVKTIDTYGQIEHLNWRQNYNKLREATGTINPGYLLHEAVNWNPITRKWYFLPRRVSIEEYDEVKDEERCGNIAIIANEDFSHVEVKELGVLHKLRGFSSFKFIPFRESEIVALKTQEKDEIATYITVINIETGETLIPETKISSTKFEGIEFL